MKKEELCLVQKISFLPSQTIERQGTYTTICKYLKKGYLIQENRNGYWVLIQKSRVLITLKNSNGIETLNFKRDILEYYGKKKLTEKQVLKFAQDLEAAKVAIYSTNGYYCIKNQTKPKKSS